MNNHIKKTPVGRLFNKRKSVFFNFLNYLFAEKLFLDYN
jgi:hypothetical protein